MELMCLFCGKDLSKEVFRKDYSLYAVADSESDPDSLTKVAKPIHPECLKKFLQMNWEEIKGLFLVLLGTFGLCQKGGIYDEYMRKL